VLARTFRRLPTPQILHHLCGVSFIDNAGKVLLKEMYRLGAELLAEGCLNQAIVTEIIAPWPQNGTRDPKDKDKDKIRRKDRLSFSTSSFSACFWFRLRRGADQELRVVG